MRKWIAAVLLIIGAATVPFSASESFAQAPNAQGWWWQYRQIDLPVDPKGLVPQYPGTPELPPPASVPEDGLYVAGNPTGTEAISALSYVIPEGASADKLTLVAAAPLTPTTTIQLCGINASWQPVQAGRWAAKPLYQCAPDAPVGVVPADGATVTFTLGKLGQQQLIDVALVPTDGSVFQANFNKPDAKSLNVLPAAAADTSGAGTGSGVLGTSDEVTSINTALDDPSYFAAISPSLLPQPDQNVGAAPVLSYPNQNNTVQPTASTSSTKDALQNFGIFGLIALAAMFSRFRGQPVREPRSLVNFGKRVEAEQ